MQEADCGAGSLSSVPGVGAEVKALFNLHCVVLPVCVYFNKNPFILFLRFAPLPSITHVSHTHFWQVLSPRPWVKHEKEKKRANFEDFHLSCEELFLILTSKRIKVTTEETGAVSVESQDFGVSNQGGYAAHFSRPVCDLGRNFSKLSRRDLEKNQSVAKTHRFSALVSSCWGSDSTVTYNLLVSTLASPPECIARHPAVRHFSQRLN